VSESKHFKWLLVVEGSTDRNTYAKLLSRYGVAYHDVSFVHGGGKDTVCNTSAWSKGVLDVLHTALGRRRFIGIILLVDSDNNSGEKFDIYKRNDKLPYVEDLPPTIVNKGCYWHIDELIGVNIVPIYGINVPMTTSGCLETDLLDTYGFPIHGQTEYANIVDAIQKASSYWQIPKRGDGKDWWEINQRAKMDKFIYSAFTHGFEVSELSPCLPDEPNVITNIKSVLYNEKT
jgi:hypothetical protein